MDDVAYYRVCLQKRRHDEGFQLRIISSNRVVRTLTRYKTFAKWEIFDLARKKGMRWASYVRLLQYLFLKLLRHRRYLDPLFGAHRYYPTQFLTMIVRWEGRRAPATVQSLLPNTELQHFARVASSRILILKTPDIRDD